MWNINTRAKFVFLFLVGLLLLSCTKRVLLKDIVQEQGKSVVLVATYDKGGNPITFGSGFFVSQDGIIATNYHVIEEGYGAVIKTSDGTTYEDVYLLSYDSDKDVALLKVDEAVAPAVKIGDSNLVMQGDRAVAIGNPEGFQNTVSDGIISGIREYDGMKIFQITCPISEGSSGGPLYNLNGEVIGITTIMSKVGQNLNFAVPINYISVLQQDETRLSLREKYLRDREKLLSSYAEKQKASSELDPKEALFREAYDLYEKARQTLQYPDYFDWCGTEDLQGVESLEQAVEVNPYYHAAYFVLGLSYRSIENYKKAEEYFLKAIELKPKYQPSYVRLADLYKSQKQLDEALGFYDKALNVGAPTGHILASIGEIYLEKDELSRAEHFYKKILDLDVVLPVYFERIATFYLKTGNLEQSWKYLKKGYFYYTEEALPKQIALYKKYLAKDNYYAFASVGRIYYWSFKYEEAIKHFEKARKLNPTTFDQYYELGMAYKESEKYEKAIDLLEKAIAKEPMHYDAITALAGIYGLNPGLVDKYKVKPNYSRAIELYKKAKETKPDNADLHRYLGQVYYYDKQYYNAISETKKALELQKDSPASTRALTHSQLGDIYFGMKEYSTALQHHKKSLELDDQPFYEYPVIKTLIELREYEEAISLVEKYVKEHESDSGGRNLLAQVYWEKGDYSSSIKEYKKSLEIDPTNYNALFGIAYCHSKSGNLDLARHWYEKVLEVAPENSPALHNLGFVYWKKQEYSKALGYFRKVLAIEPDNTQAKGMIEDCQFMIARKAFPEKLRKLSHREDDIGILASLFLCTLEYFEANNLWIRGVEKTEYKDGQNLVSPKIYEAQGILEKIKKDLEKIVSNKDTIGKMLDTFSYALDQGIKGIEQHSQGYYTKVAEYQGEYEKGCAKIRLADTYYVDMLKMLQGEIGKHESYFGNVAKEQLKNLLAYFEYKY